MCKKTVKNASNRMTSLLGPRSVSDRRLEYLPTTGEVQNVQKGHVYVFGNSDVTEEEINTDNSIELPEIRGRGKKKSLSNDVSRTRSENSSADVDEIRIGQTLYKIVERNILPGDSLQVFALQYGVPISEIKRVNNFMSDQDFHALKKIKVPVRLHGLLQEEEEERRRRPVALTGDAALHSSVTSLDEDPTSPSDLESGDEHYYRTISIRMKDESDKRKFLKKMDRDLQKICEQTKTSKDSLDEVTKELTVPRFYPLRRTGDSMSKCLADFTVTWKSIVFVLIVVIGVSAFAIFAFLELYSDDPPGTSKP